MTLTGTIIGFICVVALLLASLLIAFLDKKEKSKGNLEKGRFLSRTALILFLGAFVGGAIVTLMHGVKPREERQVMTGRGMMGAGPMVKIGEVDPKEIQTLQEKITKNPRDVKSRERLGHIYLQQQDFENVFKMSHDALEINPRSAESRVHLGMVLFAIQEHDKAIEQFDTAISIDPTLTESYLFKGIVLFQGKQDLKGAKKTWEQFMKVAKPADTGRPRVQMFLRMIDSQ